MSVTIKCERPFGKNYLKEIIESCGCCPPMDPQCPPCSTSCSPQSPIWCYTCPTPPCKLEPKPNCCPPVTCMPCSPPSVPCPYICSPCTSRVTCIPMPKPVPAPYEVGSVFRVPVTTGGLFYIGTIKCNPCSPFAC